MTTISMSEQKLVVFLYLAAGKSGNSDTDQYSRQIYQSSNRDTSASKLTMSTLGFSYSHSNSSFFEGGLFNFDEFIHSKKFESNNSTSKTDVKNNTWLEHQLDSLFELASDEKFETGMDSEFTRNLQSLFDIDPLPVLVILQQKLDNQQGENNEVLAELMNWASYQDDSSVQSEVVNLLDSGLSHSSPHVRDNATTGLYCLQGIESIEKIRSAAKNEIVPELKTDMLDLIRAIEVKLQ